MLLPAWWSREARRQHEQVTERPANGQAGGRDDWPALASQTYIQTYMHPMLGFRGHQSASGRQAVKFPCRSHSVEEAAAFRLQSVSQSVNQTNQPHENQLRRQLNRSTSSRPSMYDVCMYLCIYVFLYYVLMYLFHREREWT